MPLGPPYLKLLLLTITWLILSDTLRVCLSYRRIWISHFYIWIRYFYGVSFVFGTWAWPYHYRFRLLVPKRYCIPDRSSILTVHARSWPLLSVHERSYPFLTVPDRSPFMTFSERFLSFLSVLCAFSIVLLALSIV